MKRSLHASFEAGFDRLAAAATRFLGSSFTFLIAVGVVAYWICSPEFFKQNNHEIIRDGLLAITFLSFFIVQKSVNRYSAAMHLKLNELIASHEKASNKIVNVEVKTEEEIRDMAKEYEDIAQRSNEEESRRVSDEGNKAEGK